VIVKLIIQIRDKTIHDKP